MPPLAVNVTVELLLPEQRGGVTETLVGEMAGGRTQLTATLETFASAVPLPFCTVQNWPEGWVCTLTL